MNGLAVLFLLINAAALLGLSRSKAALPLLVGTCYMTLGQGLEFGPFSFSILRMLVLVGFIRALVRNERPAGGINRLDWIMILWGIWACLSSVFHAPPNAALIYRLGRSYDTLGIYFLFRTFCQSKEDLVLFIKFIAFLLVPVALEMMFEQLTGRNLFAIFGGVSEAVTVRDGRLRANGPFQHSILAGTVGAVCAPLMIGLWRIYPRIAKVGLTACLIMVFTSASSGPILSTMAAGFALLIWRWRHLTRHLRIAAVIGYILLDMVMKAPAYYLMGRIDLTGSSTGYHRARLIESSIEHLDEWWFSGTDFTRHWMATGVSWSVDHTDITNHYLSYGVMGGLPLMVLFIVALGLGFQRVGRSVQSEIQATHEVKFMYWCIGASLFSHATTSLSVSYFDQSILFLHACLAMAGSLPNEAKSPD